MPEAGVLHGPLPDIAGTCEGPLIICGGGHGLVRDLSSAVGRQPLADIMAVNDAGMYIANLAHWFSAHSDFFPGWCEVRSQRLQLLYGMNGSSLVRLHAKQGAELAADIHWPITGRYGPLSGHSAAIVAVALGYDPIVLAGLPADAGGHFFPALVERGQIGNYDHGQGALIEAWKMLRDEYFEGRVKSVSGNTMEILGAP